MKIMRFLGAICSAALLLLGTETSRAFSLLGPINEPYQVALLSFAQAGDLGAPKNLGEEYRWNIPVIYYSFDQSFLDYFGSCGVTAVEQAFAVLNKLPPVSSMSTQLEEFPLAVRKANYRALASNLRDVKSSLLELLVEQLGLAEPERFTWILHSRIEYSPCPPLVCSYLVQSRNFYISPTDYTVLQVSPYVNGAFYSYQIVDGCGGPADAVEVSPDPFAAQYSAVASYSLASGEFYTDLTRDDAAGLRYLMSSNNINFEAVAPGTTEIPLTNNSPTALQLLVTSNLTLLSWNALTNDPATLAGLYPNLLINSYVPSFTNVVTTNITSYYTNYPWSVAGSPPTLAFATNYDTNASFIYNYQFGNVHTNTYYSNTLVTLMITNIGPAPWSVPDAPVYRTNVTMQQLSMNIPSGDFYILPTNQCGVVILSNVLTKVYALTNTVVPAFTNLPPPTTNQPGSNTYSFYTNYSETYIYYFTNHQLAVFPVVCASNGLPMLRRGVEKITFVRRDYDSLLGQFFEPLTNHFTSVGVTNNTNWTQTVYRYVVAPDFLITAQDLNPGPSAVPGTPTIARSINFNETYARQGLAGPGTIEPPAAFTYNKSGIAWINTTPFLTQIGGVQQYTWASFDGSTNTPIVYPNGASITNIENQMVMQITTTTLPAAITGSSYRAALTGQGGQAPYVWSLAPSSAGMPPGLVLFSDGVVSGVAQAAGTYDIVVRMTDIGGRYVDRDLSLTVTP